MVKFVIFDGKGHGAAGVRGWRSIRRVSTERSASRAAALMPCLLRAAQDVDPSVLSEVITSTSIWEISSMFCFVTAKRFRRQTVVGHRMEDTFPTGQHHSVG